MTPTVCSILMLFVCDGDSQVRNNSFGQITSPNGEVLGGTVAERPETYR